MPAIPYVNQNIFARILRKELPCVKVHEDDNTLSFMDIMPRANGHVLVIPKIPARTLEDIMPDQLSKLILATQKIAIAAKRGLDADGITLHQFNENSGGQVVLHMHFHIIPRFNDVPLHPHSSKIIDSGELEIFAQKIRNFL